MTSSPSTDADVIIVGAGLAGLRAAQVLNHFGREVLLLERGSSVGGRLRSHQVDGYVIDEGFQLINPAYPELQSSGVLRGFDLRSFALHIDYRHGTQSFVLGDPRDAPLPVLRGLLGGPFAWRDVLAFVRLAQRVLRDPKRPSRHADSSTLVGFQSLGFSPQAIDAFWQPFLRGTLLSDSLAPSFQYVTLLLRTFLRGAPGTHPEGIQALPQAFARALTSTRILLNTTVTNVSPTHVDTNEGSFRARTVLVATDASDANTLGGDDAPAWYPQITFWWDAPHVAQATDLRIDLDCREVSSALAVSSVAPERAPAGRLLIATPCNDLEIKHVDEQRVRESVARCYGLSTSDLALVTSSEVRRALPERLAPLRQAKVVNRHGVFYAGDYLATPSIQGALTSGHHAARAILAQTSRN